MLESDYQEEVKNVIYMYKILFSCLKDRLQPYASRVWRHSWFLGVVTVGEGREKKIRCDNVQRV